MTSDPQISVVVCTRNRAQLLPHLLRSLADQQSAATFEVVVIDNGSTDATPDLLEDWCRREPKFTTACEPLPGLSRAKNFGVRITRGDLLLFTDDDMRIDPDWVESYRRFFAEQRHRLLLAGGPVIPIPHDLGEWPRWLNEKALADAGSLDYRGQRELRRFEYVWGGNMAVPRAIFDRVGQWDESAGLQGDQRVAQEDSEFFEDTELQDRVRNAGGSTWFCPGARVHHRVDRRSVTPRRITSTAFARGRNDFWQERLRTPGQVESLQRVNALQSVLSLAGNILLWGFWLVLFRFSSAAPALEHARRAAFQSGRSLDSLRSGKKSRHLFLGAARVTFRARSLLVRLAPDFY